MYPEVAQTVCCESQLGLDDIQNGNGAVWWEIQNLPTITWLSLNQSLFLNPRPRLFFLSYVACPVKIASMIGFIISQVGSGSITTCIGIQTLMQMGKISKSQ